MRCTHLIAGFALCLLLAGRAEGEDAAESTTQSLESLRLATASQLLARKDLSDPDERRLLETIDDLVASRSQTAMSLFARHCTFKRRFHPIEGSRATTISDYACVEAMVQNGTPSIGAIVNALGEVEETDEATSLLRTTLFKIARHLIPMNSPLRDPRKLANELARTLLVAYVDPDMDSPRHVRLRRSLAFFAAGLGPTLVE